MYRSALIILAATMSMVACKSKDEDRPKDEAAVLSEAPQASVTPPASKGGTRSAGRPAPATASANESANKVVNKEIVEGHEPGSEAVQLKLGADEGIYDSEMQRLGGRLNRGTVTASSSLCEKGARLCHRPQRVVDSRSNTAWCEGVTGLGVDQWVAVDLGRPTQLVGIRFEPFYAKDKARMFGNGRVKRLELQTDTARYELAFADQDPDLAFKPGMQLDYHVPALTLLDHPALKAPVVTRRIRFVIKEVYPGAQHEDTCISSLDIYTKAPPKGATAGWLTGRWTVKVLDGSAGEIVTSATLTFAGKDRFDLRSTVQLPRESKPQRIRRTGSYLLEGELLSVPDLDSGLLGCRPLKRALKARADAVTRGCRYFKPDPSTLLIWYPTTGPVRRVLERWTKER